ncbi:exosome complex component RRP45A isoform X1 [Elaeis guineensis]|uniref:exosome complex component RRP45A isoform X1 n=1 Tax=Elaeis guineensis var. tenera TaxID=51953 RepID=UPI003C6D8A4C
MEQRLANIGRMTVNEKKFIETALLSDLRIDGRRPFDYRKLTIKFGRHDGSSEVQLGETHVMGYVTSQLVQPYRDRPNEGTLAIFTEFSPMADPSFEAGRPGESAIELGRVIDRGLRESRAVDMESLCVVAGKSVWAIRVDLHILDNGGNLIDAANIAALAALLTFRRPECTLGGENGQEVIVHDPEVREPLPLIVHHLPVAVTFAIFGEGNIMVIDPTYKEEAVMGGRMTATLNSNGDVCAVQKAGGEGIMSSVIMQCLRIASVKAADITSKIKNAVDAYNTERALRKVKRHPPSVALEVCVPDVIMEENQVDELSRHEVQNLKDEPERGCGNDGSRIGVETSTTRGKNNVFIGGPSSWDPYSKGISSCFISSQDLPGPLKLAKEQEEAKISQNSIESHLGATNTGSSGPVGASVVSQQANSPKSLKDAVKPKHRKKNKASSASDMS